LHVLSELSDNIPLRGIFADKELSFPKAAGEDAVTGLNGATYLGRCLPDHLSEMRRLGIVRVVARDFIRPRLDSRRDTIAVARAGSQIFSEWTKGATRMFKFAVVSPLLGFAGQIIAPGQIRSTVLGADRVVRGQVLPDITVPS